MRRIGSTLLVAGALLAGCSSARQDVVVASASTRMSTSTNTSTGVVTSSTTAIATTTSISTSPAEVELPPSTTASATTATPTPATPTSAALPTPSPPPDESATAPKRPGATMGSIEIPKLGLALAFYEGVSLRTLDQGPGHWPGTAMPGEAGNVVIAGHRVSHSRPFRYIDQLVAGDQVIFTVDGRRSTYVVTGHDTVTPDHVEIVGQTADPTATLFACHPPGSTQYRWVVHLQLLEPERIGNWSA